VRSLDLDLHGDDLASREMLNAAGVVSEGSSFALVQYASVSVSTVSLLSVLFKLLLVCVDVGRQVVIDDKTTNVLHFGSDCTSRWRYDVTMR